MCVRLRPILYVTILMAINCKLSIACFGSKFGAGRDGGSGSGGSPLDNRDEIKITWPPPAPITRAPPAPITRTPPAPITFWPPIPTFNTEYPWPQGNHCIN